MDVNRDDAAERVVVEQKRRDSHRGHGVPRPHLRQRVDPPTVPRSGYEPGEIKCPTCQSLTWGHP